MIDRNPDRNKKGTLPTFTPVPRQRERYDGWTPERQRGFIEALADTGSVRAAAHAVNMTPEGAYLLRRHPEAGGFRKAWEAALKCGVQRLEDVAMERALYGVEVPVYHFGAVVGTRREFNDRLLMFMLRNRAAKRFSADSWQKTDAYTRQQLEKLKRQWRAEWEEERRVDSAQVIENINRKLDRMREVMREEMSEEELRLEAELEAARRRRLALPAPSPDGWADADEGEDEEEGL
jgi:hypothetical protein